MKKTVWIMNHYAGNMFFDQGGRHYNFSKYLKQAGYEPVIFCCNASHNKPELYFPGIELWEEHIAEEIGVPFIFAQGRTYTGNGKQRVLNMIDFYRNVKKAAKEYAKLHGKPDVIYASSVHPLTLVAGIQIARHFGIKCICEVRDLWPESIVVYFSKLKKNNPLIRLLYKGEKWIYKKADALIFTMEGAYDYIVEQGWEKDIPRSKVHYINNGVDLEAFQYNREHFQIEDSDLQNPDIFKVVYTGSIRLVNNLGLLLDAAKQVTDPRVRFLIWGDGDERPMLEQRVRDEGISNVVFKGKVEKKYIPYIVSTADLNFGHYASTPILRYGASMNKLFDYLAAEKPVLIDFLCQYNPVLQCGAGISVEEPTAERIAQAVDSFTAIDEKQYQTFCDHARAGAREYDFRNLTRKLLTVIESE